VGFVLLVNTTPTSLTRVGNAGRMLWPILTGETAHTDALQTAHRSTGASPDTAALDTTDLPAARALLQRMTEAAGGARLARHPHLELHAERVYLYHGVHARIVTRWSAPDRRSDDEQWTAAGRKIGRIRAWYDGTRGGQETTFGQDATFTGEDLARARLNARLAWFAAPDSALEVRVVGRTRGSDPAYVVETRGTGETAVTRYRVSARSALVVERLRGARRERFSDFRSVDGLVLPYRAVIDDELGRSTWKLDRVEFAEPHADAFAPPRS
jgi:hypothetical protein